ncbi:hypothetical protein D4R51_03835 [bacterium]|nr:MAG: hypothetical protein D4R51_03835 [bacterium]
MNRGQKKFIYGLFYLVIFILVAWGAIFGLNSPSQPACSDPSCGAKQPLSLQVSGVPQIFRSESTHRIAVLGQVTNPNSDYGASQFSYNFKIFDRNGKTVADVLDSGAIHPSETKYILANYDTGSMDPDLLDDRPGLEIKNAIMAPAGNFLKLNISLVSQPLIRVGSSSIVVSGVVRNQNSFPTEGIGVIVILENKYGDALFAAKTAIQQIGGFKDFPLEVSFPADQSISQSLDAGKTQVFFYTQ